MWIRTETIRRHGAVCGCLSWLTQWDEAQVLGFRAILQHLQIRRTQRATNSSRSGGLRFVKIVGRASKLGGPRDTLTADMRATKIRHYILGWDSHLREEITIADLLSNLDMLLDASELLNSRLVSIFWTP